MNSPDDRTLPPFRTTLPGDPTHVIGIGASAGGVEALQILLQRFTADNSAFVVLMHLLPNRESHLVPILARVTQMSVTTAREDHLLERNSIYVIPPDFQLELTDQGALRLTRLPPTFPRSTIDKFLTSLSEIGPASIGVILSGTGVDGAEGLRDIRERGGATFVQDPATARFPQMPEKARPFADQCLAPAELGDALMRAIGAAEKAPGDKRLADRK